MGDFEEDDAGDDEERTEQAQEVERVVKRDYADREGANGTDSSPHGVGGSDGNCFLGEIKKNAAERHGYDGEGDPREFVRRACRHFQTERPTDFKRCGDQEVNPSQHDFSNKTNFRF